MAIQPHSRIESQLTDPTYKGPYLSRIELILKDMLENYGRIAFVGPYDSLEDLPETGQAGYVYLVRVEGSNLCDEYIWDEQEEEYNYVGRFEIDLDDYQTKDLSNPITIDSVVYTTVEAALAAMNASLSNVSRDALKKVSTMPQNPSNNDLVVWHGNDTYKVGHTYKYVEGTGETLYAWQVDNPGGVGDGTVIYTKSAIPNEDTNIYKSDGTAYSSSTDDPTYELMVGGESAITIEIFSSSQMQSWERSALRKSSEDIVATSGEWVEVTKDNIQDDWEQSDSSAPDYIKNKPMLGTAASRNATNQITEGSTALPEAGAVKTALDSKEKSGVAETLVKDTVGWIVPGKNKWNVGNDISEWLATGSNGTKILGGSISTRVTADIDADTSSIKVTNYDTTGWWSMSKVIKLEKNTNYKLVNFGNITKWVVGLSSLEPETIGTEITVSDDVFNSGNYDYWIISIFPNAVDVSNMMVLLANESDVTFEPYHATVDDAKADKVTNATSGHLAGLDSNGNLTDSGVSPTEDVTVEGNPVTFDSPFEQDAKSVVVSVKPIQDLHGYDAPWPAGGGKNKLPLTMEAIKAINTSGTWTGNIYTKDGMSYTILVDDGNNVVGIRVNGDTSVNTSLNLPLFSLPTGTYIVSVGALRSRLNKNGSQIADITANQSYTLTVDSDSDEYILYLYPGATSISNVIVYPMIRLSTETDATFAPYSNECPISGIDEVEIVDRGENFFANLTKDTSKGYIDNYYLTSNGSTAQSGGYYVSEYLEIKPNTAYYIGGILGNAHALCYYDSNKTYISSVQYANQESITDTSPSNAKYMRLSVLKANESLYMVRYASAIVTTTIPLPSTLYGGTVDVTNGSADENNGFVEFDGTDNTGWTFNGTYGTSVRFDYSGLSLEPVIGSDKSISNYLTLINIGTNDLEGFNFHAINRKLQVQIHADRLASSDVSGLMGFFVSNPLQVCYKLATPTTLSFTPTDVELLEGTNVVSTNAEKVAVTYKAGILATLGDIDDLNDKVKTKFDKANVATIEPRSTASKKYYKGDYIVRPDGCLYDVTATIASGAAFTNSNTHKTNLGDELNKFKVYVATADSPVNGNEVASVSMSGYLPISPFQVFSWTGSGTVSITPKSSGGTWNVSGDVSNVRYGQIFMRT